MIGAEFYTSIVSNSFIILGYIIGTTFNECSPKLYGSFLIMIGHLVAMFGEAHELIEDLVYLKENNRNFRPSHYFFLANMLSVLGEYKEMQNKLQNEMD